LKGIFVNKSGQIRSGWKMAIVGVLYFVIANIITIVPTMIYFLKTIYETVKNGGSVNFDTAELTADLLSHPLYGTIVSVLSYLSLIAAIIIVLKFIDKKRLKDIGLNNPINHIKELIFGLLLGAVSISLVFAILLLSGNLKMANGFNEPNFNIQQVTGLILFIFVGIDEEMFSRGYCMTVLQQTGKKWVPPVISAVIFSLLHLLNPNVSFMGILNIFLVGLLLSYMTIKTRDLWMPIGYHITWNYFQGNVFGLAVSGTSRNGIYNVEYIRDNLLTGGGFGPEGGIVATGAIILGFLLVFLYSKYVGRNVKEEIPVQISN